MVLEATSHGAPFLEWPMTAEQYISAKFLVEEVGACVEIGRGNTCEVKDEDKARKILMVMGENDVGVRIRKRVCKVREIIEDAKRYESDYKGSSVKVIDEFLNVAMSMKL